MRTKAMILLFVLPAIAAAGAMQACSDSSSDNPSSSDAGGPDVTGGRSDASSDSGNQTPTCDTSHDFTTDVPSEAIADSGATTAACVACLKSKCSAEVTACNTDCDCQAVAAKGLVCYETGGSDPSSAAVACFGVSSQVTGLLHVPAVAQTLIDCANASCADPCNITLDGGTGTSNDDAGDQDSGGT